MEDYWKPTKPELVEGCKTEVRITRFTDEELCVVKSKIEEDEDYAAMEEKIWKEGEGSVRFMLNPKNREACLVRAKHGSEWYRGRVSIQGKRMVLVEYVDYLSEKWTPVSRLRQISRELHAKRIESRMVRLDGVKVVDEELAFIRALDRQEKEAGSLWCEILNSKGLPQASITYNNDQGESISLAEELVGIGAVVPKQGPELAQKKVISKLQQLIAGDIQKMVGGRWPFVHELTYTVKRVFPPNRALLYNERSEEVLNEEIPEWQYGDEEYELMERYWLGEEIVLWSEDERYLLLNGKPAKRELMEMVLLRDVVKFMTGGKDD